MLIEGRFWYTRVPTECNPADAASRLYWAKMDLLVPGGRRLVAPEALLQEVLASDGAETV